MSEPSSRGSASSQPAPRSDSIEARLRGKRERVHILTGRICNNNCLFCMEEDREGRAAANAATDDARVRWILDDNPGCEEVCFTSGEPTTNPGLARWARWARDRGVARVSVMTNGRALCYPDYAARLLAAGINRFYISIHGHTEKLHQSLTRTPGSFAQTVAGIETVARLRRSGIDLHTSTVLTSRTLPHLHDIYRFLRARGVDQVVFNGLQPNGRADTFFDQLVPRYPDVAAAAARFLAAASAEESPVEAFLVDLPPCATVGLPDYNRGYVEAYAHYEPAAGVALPTAEPATGDWVRVARSDLDRARREKRAACRRCRLDPLCEGVWDRYLARYGWDGLEPVE